MTGHQRNQTTTEGSMWVASTPNVLVVAIQPDFRLDGTDRLIGVRATHRSHTYRAGSGAYREVLNSSWWREAQ